MIRAIRLALLIIIVCPAAAGAQSVRLGLEAARWKLSGGTGTTAAMMRNGVTGTMTLVRDNWSPQLLVSFVGEGDFEPGVVAVAAGVHNTILGSDEDASLFVAVHAGIGRLNAQNHERAVEACTPEIGCMYESGTRFSTGTRAIVNASLGAHVRLSDRIGLSPGVGIMSLVGSESNTFGRLGLSIVAAL